MNKTIIFFFSIVISSMAQAGFRFSDIVKFPDGTLRYMSHLEAKQYCADDHTHLPTPREFALFAIDHGAVGIRESLFQNIPVNDLRVVEEIGKNQNQGFSPIYTVTSAESIVIDFYYNASGYRRGYGELGDYSFHASTMNPKFAHAYYFLGFSGAIESENSRDGYFVVSCITQR